MPGDLSTATAAVITLSVALLIGFFVGSWRNRRRARDQANWLRSALRGLGLEPEFPSLGAFGFSAQATSNAGPIRAVQAFVILVPREVLPLWAARAVLESRDILTAQLTFATPPPLQGDLIDPNTRFGQKAIRRLPHSWPRQGVGGLVAAGPDSPATEHLADVAGARWETLRSAYLVSVRRKTPHLLVTLQAPSSETQAREALAQIWDMAMELAEGAKKPQA